MVSKMTMTFKVRLQTFFILLRSASQSGLIAVALSDAPSLINARPSGIPTPVNKSATPSAIFPAPLKSSTILPIALRKSLDCVRNGSYAEHDADSDTRYVYSRETRGQKLLVVCSFSDREQAFSAPDGFDLAAARLVLNSHGETRQDVLKPYESRVYLWD